MKKKGIIKEFKEFIMRGNVLDLAVGVIIGAAFQAIIKSFVDDVFSPLIGALIGNTDFSNLKIVLREATDTTDAVIFSYGNFITAVVNFLLMSVCIFAIVKVFNTIRNKAIIKEKNKSVEETPPTTKICPFCKSEIAVDATRCPHCTSRLEE